MTKPEIIKIIETGETEQIEYKLNFGSSVITSLNAFANSKGGRVFVGVDNFGNILGVKLNCKTGLMR